jgi:hypothetical protein
MYVFATARRSGFCPGGPPPLGDQRHAHDHVAGNHDAVVDVVALVDRRKQVGYAERQYQHPNHLEHREQPEDPVVGVVGRGEPREVDPRPADRERDEAEPDQAGAKVILSEVVRELVGRDPERDHERQVEQQLERRGGTVALLGVAPGHAHDAMGHGRWHARMST